GEILVAIGLVDLALAAEFRLQWLHRNAVRRRRAVAASFADEIVDERPFRRVGIEAALAPPPLLRRAGLVEDEDGEALDFAQLPLHAIKLAPMMDGRPVREIGSARIFLRLVRDDGDALGALGCDLMRDLRDAEAAFGGLAAGHRHR